MALDTRLKELAPESPEAQHIADRCRQRAAFENLQASLQEVGYICWEVQADGSCGVWSLLSLIADEPMLRPLAQEEADLRFELQDCWKDAARMAAWQLLFPRMVMPSDSERSAPKRGHAESGQAKTAKSSVSSGSQVSSSSRAWLNV